MKSSQSKRTALGFLLLVILAGCAAGTSTSPITITPAASLAAGADAMQTHDVSTPTASQLGIIQPSPSPSPPAQTVFSACQDSECVLDSGLWLQRPIPDTANQLADRSYNYGSTQLQTREPHHGVEFTNPSGTHVLAAAPGTVIYAGDDKTTLFGAWPDFYGNLVILQHAALSDGTPVYTLYGHLSKILVEVGDTLQAGELIGQVGMSGSAIGSHLHFEVRLGENAYDHTRNPNLYVQAFSENGRPTSGVLAGKIIDEQNKPWRVELSLQYLDAPDAANNPLLAPEGYAYGTPRDPTLQENFVLGDLPAGRYRLAYVYNNTVFSRVISILPGKITFVNLDTQPTPTP